MKLLLSCDDVFDALTSGSFAAYEDDSVREHVEECPHCRQLAEETELAADFLGEAVRSCAADPPNVRRARSLADRTFARFQAEERVDLARTQRDTFFALTPQAWSQVGAAAAVLLALGGLFWAASPGTENPSAVLPVFPSQLARASTPGENGLLQLASLRLPDGCVNLASASDVSRYVCCTRCHREGDVIPAARLVAFSQQSCLACHKS